MALCSIGAHFRTKRTIFLRMAARKVLCLTRVKQNLALSLRKRCGGSCCWNVGGCFFLLRCLAAQLNCDNVRPHHKSTDSSLKACGFFPKTKHPEESAVCCAMYFGCHLWDLSIWGRLLNTAILCHLCLLPIATGVPHHLQSVCSPGLIPAILRTSSPEALVGRQKPNGSLCKCFRRWRGQLKVKNARDWLLAVDSKLSP